MTKDEALVQPAPVQSCYCPNCEAMGKELVALKAQSAPVCIGWDDKTDTPVMGYTTPPAQPAPVQEPLTWLKTIVGKFVEALPHEKDAKPVYLTPPAAQRQWVGLTLTERNQLCRDIAASTHQVRAIEAKLKEKNT
jgi:hypothetical protein